VPILEEEVELAYLKHPTDLSFSVVELRGAWL
jgi:hypothetical protein